MLQLVSHKNQSQPVRVTKEYCFDHCECLNLCRLILESAELAIENALFVQVF